jgi:DNA-directed RNA polymerase I subunit RPA43
MLSLLGSLQPDPFSPRHVPHQKPEKAEGSESDDESVGFDNDSSDSEDEEQDTLRLLGKQEVKRSH